MAQSFLKKASKYFSKINLQESYATIVLAGIIVIVLGLLVANYFTKRDQSKITETGESVKTQEEIAQSGGDYKVVAGDSLSKISEKFYNNRDLWPALVRENKIRNPNIIFVDMTLKIPAQADAEKTKELLTQKSYKVESGDTLFTIAEKVYGDGAKWVILDKANGQRRLPNGNPLVFAGSSIVVPR